MHKGVIPIFLMIVAAVLVSGCIFSSSQLDKIPPHIIAATEALSDLDLIEGNINTFSLDDEIYLINQLLSDNEGYQDDEEQLSSQYHAYRTWNDAFELMSQILRDDYMIYQSHLRQAERLYEDFNYVGWREEIIRAKSQAARMAEKSREAAYMMDTIPTEDIPADLQQSLRQSRYAMMEIARQSTSLENTLQQML
ncbi:hypothetical protein [Methanocalculus chunghsingensis]|uniref:hypothetical protein n=1 Tax=Methanocalculus chunghsingensis TaxID=156457 RepID=UPI001B8B806B|nr:hypothetical protein [Methanocalculus chunghsingensis]